MPKEPKDTKHQHNRSSTTKKLKKIKHEHSHEDKDRRGQSTIKSSSSSFSSSSSSQSSKLLKLISSFNKLFIEDKQPKPTEKQLIEFSRENLMNITQSQDDPKLNYQNLVCFILKISGIDIDLEDKGEKKKFTSIDEASCTNIETIDDLISNANLRIRRMKLKGNQLGSVLFSITEQLYNSYDIVHESDFNQLKKLIIAMLKLTKNRYRKIRYIGCEILSAIVELLYSELSSTLKIMKQKKKSSKERGKDKDRDKEDDEADKSSFILLRNKVKIFEELIQILKEKFIQKKIADISQNIRMLICDSLIRISKKHFDLLFNDQQLIKLFPFFLNDPSPVIKIKYLQLLYDKLDSTPEDDPKTLKILISILSIARDAILNICIKEDKVLAKQGIKIIELLSQHKILEIKTVHQLLPHLFNQERGIRLLISKVVKNYILNFENENDEDEDNAEGEGEEGNDDGKEGKHNKNKDSDIKSKNKTIEKKKIILTKANVNDLVEFICKLTDNECNMVSMLVDNFFDMFNIFKDFRLFFDYIDESLSSTQSEMNLIHTAFQVMGFSIDKIQKRLDYNKDDASLNSINDEYNNLLIAKAKHYIKKFRLPLYENYVNSTQCEIFNTVLELFNRLRITQGNVITFTFEIVLEIVNELKQAFFINIVTFAHNELNTSGSYSNVNTNTNAIDNNDNDNGNETVISPDQVLFEKLCENLLKSINSIMNSAMLFSFFNNNQAKYLDEVIYSDKTNSLAKLFCDMLSKEILVQKCYKTLDSDAIERFVNDKGNGTKEKLYLMFTQMNYLLVFFKKIFSNTSMIDFNSFAMFLLKILILNINISNNDSDLNNNNDSLSYSLEFNFKFNSIILSLIETIHLFIFEYESDTQEHIGKYLMTRNEIINTILSVLVIKYKDDNQSALSRKYNNYLLQLKTKSVGYFLDTLTYISSEKIKVSSMRFELTTEIVSMLIDFTKENFIDFFLKYNHWFKKDIEEGNALDTQANFCFNKQESIFSNELAIKTYCFKIFAEKYSRLMLLNYGMFKYIDMSCLYFETFYLIKHQKVIEAIITHVFETLMEKEVLHYISNVNNAGGNNNNDDVIMNDTTNNVNSKSNVTILIFYLTKITMKIFNNKVKILGDLSSEDKLNAISRYSGYYLKTLKKLKVKYNKNEGNGSVNVCDKDKNFYENFLLNGMNFALEAKREVKVETEKKKAVTRIDIENVEFLEVVRHYLKMNVFLNDVDVKNMILAYLKLSKGIELTDHVNMSHIRAMERFKSYLLHKGKVVLAKKEKEGDRDGDGEDNDNGDENDKERGNDDNAVAATARKKRRRRSKRRERRNAELEEKSDDEMNEEKKEEDDEERGNDDNNNRTPEKRKKEKSNRERQSSTSNNQTSTRRKKRRYSEVENNEDENNTEEKQSSIKKKKKQKEK